jgi:hypothetical protein
MRFAFGAQENHRVPPTPFRAKSVTASCLIPQRPCQRAAAGLNPVRGFSGLGLHR